MGVTDQLLANNRAFADTFDKAGLHAAPGEKVVVITCMDARINAYAVLGLQEGDAHVLRNAGGVVTDDQIRSLAISQRLLGTEEVVLIHHTDCGMLRLSEDGFKRDVLDDVGIRPPWSVEGFSDLDEDVRQSIARIRANPFVPHRDAIRGFVYDVETGLLREVDASEPAAGA